MESLKDKIEQEYIRALYVKETVDNFASRILELIGDDSSRKSRSGSQSRARWVYLTMIANELNDNGNGFQAKGIHIPVKFTKDILYHVYWEEMKRTLFPEKKRQLNQKEFGILVEHVMDLFAMIFDIHIPFPNWRDLSQQEEVNSR